MLPTELPNAQKSYFVEGGMSQTKIKGKEKGKKSQLNKIISETQTFLVLFVPKIPSYQEKLKRNG